MTTIFKSADIAAFVSELSEKSERIQLIKALEYVTGVSRPKASSAQVQGLLDKFELCEDFVYTQIMDESDELPEHINELSHFELIMKLADMCEEKIKSGPKRAIRKGGKSHAEKLVDYFGENNSATREYLEELLQTDSRNVNVAVSILRNPKRTKNPLNVQYNRSTKMFILED